MKYIFFFLNVTKQLFNKHIYIPIIFCVNKIAVFNIVEFVDNFLRNNLSFAYFCWYDYGLEQRVLHQPQLYSIYVTHPWDLVKRFFLFYRTGKAN